MLRIRKITHLYVSYITDFKNDTKFLQLRIVNDYFNKTFVQL